MQENSVMRIVYTVFLGVLIAVFVGVGINTFYEAPTPPSTDIFTTPNKDETALQEQQTLYNSQYLTYNEAAKSYSRNVSIIVLICAVILVGLSLYYEKRSSIIANGVMLGSLFTLLYAITRSMMSEDTKYIFAATTVALGVALFLGYRRFAETKSTIPGKKKK